MKKLLTLAILLSTVATATAAQAAPRVTVLFNGEEVSIRQNDLEGFNALVEYTHEEAENKALYLREVEPTLLAKIQKVALTLGFKNRNEKTLLLSSFLPITFNDGIALSLAQNLSKQFYLMRYYHARLLGRDHETIDLPIAIDCSSETFDMLVAYMNYQTEDDQQFFLANLPHNQKKSLANLAVNLLALDGGWTKRAQLLWPFADQMRVIEK